MSDERQYRKKHQILVNLLAERPDEFKVDSVEGNIAGLTHGPSGFRIHIPLRQLYRAMPQPLTVNQKLAAVIHKLAGDHSGGNLPYVMNENGEMVKNDSYEADRGEGFWERTGGVQGLWDKGWNTAKRVAGTAGDVASYVNPVGLAVGMTDAAAAGYGAVKDAWRNRDYHYNNLVYGDARGAVKQVRDPAGQYRTDMSWKDFNEGAKNPNADWGTQYLGRDNPYMHALGTTGANIGNAVNRFSNNWNASYVTEDQLANRQAPRNHYKPRPLPGAPGNQAVTQGGSQTAAANQFKSGSSKRANWMNAALGNYADKALKRPGFSIGKADYNPPVDTNPHQGYLSRLFLDNQDGNGHTPGLLHSVANYATFVPKALWGIADEHVIPASAALATKVLKPGGRSLGDLYRSYKPLVQAGIPNPAERGQGLWESVVGRYHGDGTARDEVRGLSNSLLGGFMPNIINASDRFQTLAQELGFKK